MKRLKEIDHYICRVIWSDEDERYVGLCAEFPCLSSLASSPEEALRGILRVASKVVKDMKTNGEPLPEPICSRRYSGKLMVRIPPEVHRRLALEAAEEDISLNRLISTKLSS